MFNFLAKIKNKKVGSLDDEDIIGIFLFRSKIFLYERLLEIGLICSLVGIGAKILVLFAESIILS